MNSFDFSKAHDVTWNLNANSTCNLRCRHCFAEGGSYVNSSLSLKDNLTILGKLAEHGINRISFSGGEPLLYRDLNILIGAAIDKNISIGVLTNGIALSDRRLREFRHLGVEFIQISIDGPELVHDDFRGMAGAFKKSVDAIKRASDFGFRVNIATTITKLNYLSLDSVLDLTEKLGTEWGIEHFTPIGVGSSISELALSSKERRLALSQLIKLSVKKQIKIADPTRIVEDSAFRAICRIAETYGIKSGCSIGVLGFSIAPNGDILPCPRLQYRLGNALTDNINLLWTSHPFLKAMRARDTLKGECAHCSFRDLCGGCRANAYAVKGDPFAEDSSCPKFG
jgi:radical SAM protein with 4Fe4S-binding SPASM domain